MIAQMHLFLSNDSWKFEPGTVITFLFMQTEHGMGVLWLALQSFHQTPSFPRDCLIQHPYLLLTFVQSLKPWNKKERKEMFYLTTHSTHYLRLYGVRHGKGPLMLREEVCCSHMGFSFRLFYMDHPIDISQPLLYQLWSTGWKWVHLEGSVRRFITELHLAPLELIKDSVASKYIMFSDSLSCIQTLQYMMLEHPFLDFANKFIIFCWEIGSPPTGGAGRMKLSCVVPA